MASKKKKPAKKASAAKSKKPAAKKSVAKASAKKSAAKKAAPKKAAAKAKKPAAKAASAIKSKSPGLLAPAKSPVVKEVNKMAKSSFFKEMLAPLDDRVLIQPDGASEKTAGGLFIPASAQERPLQGKVLAVGKGARNKKGKVRPLDVQVGDEVIYAQFTGTNIELDGREVVLLKESEILGIVNQ